MENKYIKNHDFGYGKEGDIQKLHLRDFENCKAYLEDVLHSIYNATVVGNTLQFDQSIVEVILEHK